LRPRTLPTESAALADVWAGLRRDADAQGVPERGVQFVTRLRARLDAVAARADRQPVRPRVACLVGLDPPGRPGAWVGELVAWAGGEPVPLPVAGGANAAGPGDLDDPDVLVFARDGGDPAAALAAVRALIARPGWSRLRAVRDGRVYVTDGDAARERPGPQVAEALEALAEILHPAAFRFGHEGRVWARVDGAGPDGARGVC
jgi:iron complex transport system substrate-binding protein